MDTSMIVKASIALGGTGLIMGGLLAVASKVFYVEVDARVELIRAVLPGINCGACGLPGCDGAAEAIVAGEASNTACVAGGSDVAKQIGALLGMDVSEVTGVANKALVRCGGGKNEVAHRYIYDGQHDCQMAQQVSGGPLLCPYGCLGLGSCITSCPFVAITLGEDGLPKIDWDKCTSCGACVKACPRGIISLVAEDKEVHVLCRSHNAGKEVRAVCKKGCIACKACEKVCEFDAIHVIDNLAVIDKDKCTDCKKCVEKCPTGCLADLTATRG
ncbi:MAG: RnfABCDGE type electron transport complex subunit B [Actinomycetota bacterium]|nr:RnfABCDGE type electron transport complex subunit B [Actinomycetota bacterium]